MRSKSTIAYRNTKLSNLPARIAALPHHESDLRGEDDRAAPAQTGTNSGARAIPLLRRPNQSADICPERR